MTSKGQIRSKANKNLVLGAKPGSLNEFESGGQIYLVYKAQDDPGTDFRNLELNSNTSKGILSISLIKANSSFKRAATSV